MQWVWDKIIIYLWSGTGGFKVSLHQKFGYPFLVKLAEFLDFFGLSIKFKILGSVGPVKQFFQLNSSYQTKQKIGYYFNKANRLIAWRFRNWQSKRRYECRNNRLRWEIFCFINYQNILTIESYDSIRKREYFKFIKMKTCMHFFKKKKCVW